MFRLLLFTTVLVGRISSSLGQGAGEATYLTTYDNWAFFKVKAMGLMTNDKVKSTCEEAGMSLPCLYVNRKCLDGWTSGCVSIEHGHVSCFTAEVLSVLLCDVINPYSCPPLQDAFIYDPHRKERWRPPHSYGCGTDYGGLCVNGSDYTNMSAICAVPANCSNSPCLNNGTCRDHDNALTCRCAPGWGGVRCERALPRSRKKIYLTTYGGRAFYKVRAIGPMTNANVKATCEAEGLQYPCHMTGGTCTGYGYWVPGCICFDGGVHNCYTLPVLASELCESEPGYCKPLHNTFVYAPNWAGHTGSSCGVNFHKREYCVHGKTQSNKYALCAADDENTLSCTRGEDCSEHPRGFLCRCDPGWTGKTCETNIDECASGPCWNRGTCVDEVNGFSCLCPPGIVGDTCEIDIDECASRPCWSGGTCVDKVNGFSCLCPPRMAGGTCEIVSFPGGCIQFFDEPTSHEDAAEACRAKGGFLAEMRRKKEQRLHRNRLRKNMRRWRSYHSYWVGIKSAPITFVYSDGTRVTDHAQLEDYTFDPVCVLFDMRRNYLARAVPCTEHHGYICEYDADVCLDDVCENGGICSSCVNNTYNFCTCPDGYTGQFCEIGKGVLESSHPRSRARRHVVGATTDVGLGTSTGLGTTSAPREVCSTTGSETEFGDPFTFECEENHTISSVTSSYCSSPSDRGWTFGCKANSGGELKECFWSPYINDFGGFMTFQCPFNSLVTGFYSTFRDDRHDRRWKVKCCKPGSHLVYNCLTTPQTNEWNDDLKFTSPSGYYMRGVHSDVSTGKRDRRYQFDLCQLIKKNTNERDRYG
ncbi:fibropellin-1-like isoform X2 [Branchiostoma lanceolatum]|uniref:fibropellin-1-like isoform X2 n=1 Tax=Branchiostoma lanceolatum TaxID=7740 RepID=UPI00345352FB